MQIMQVLQNTVSKLRNDGLRVGTREHAAYDRTSGSIQCNLYILTGCGDHITS
jgi:hypothetical protein